MKAKWRVDSQLQVLAMLPAFLVGLIFELFLGHRHDYTGHYAAGYGATLMGGMLCMRWLDERKKFVDDRRWVLFFVGTCIAAGAVTELTIFAFARPDGIDFCSQSLGATLAGLVLVGWSRSKLSNESVSAGIVIGSIFLGLGAVYAVR